LWGKKRNLGNPLESNIRAFYPSLRCYVFTIKHPSSFFRAGFPTENLYGFSYVLRMQHVLHILYFLIRYRDMISLIFTVI
jgi:hypothetical protein